jgi:hypothetical protein
LPAALLTIVVAGVMAPLADPDLPMHLAVGRWIVEHRAVPFTEPFAWTRPDAPYFAYSWLVQSTMYLLMHAAGPIALRVLHGVLFAAAFWSVILAGRELGWSRDATCAVAATQLIVLTSISPLLRPQEVLFFLLPLGWMLTARLLGPERGGMRTTFLGLGLVAAVTANTHVFFPLLAAPVSLALTLTREAGQDSLRRRIRRAAPVAITVILGAACSPYALDWVQLFELNFRPNALFGQSSLIAEHQAGFSSRLGLGAALTVLPLICAGAWTKRERIVWGTMWAVGLIVFALRVKGLVVWWFLAFPLTGMSAEVLLGASSAYRIIPKLITFAVPAASAFGFASGVPPTIVPLTRAWRAEHVVPGITLSSPAALATDSLLARLVSYPRVRVLTVFDLGSYLTWRAPGFSASIDGRTIFPDSAALPDAALPSTAPERSLGPWRSADAAMVPLAYPVAAVLDTATGWERLAQTDSPSSPFGPVGLWLNTTGRDSTLTPARP